MLHAPRTAAALGRPLNTFVTIRMWQLGSDEWSVSKDVLRLRSEWFQRWSRRPARGGSCPANGTPTHTGVIEAKGGVHMHWMLHIKSANDDWFEKSLIARVKRQFGIKVIPDGAIEIKQIDNPEGLKLYFAKTLIPRYARAWNIRTVSHPGHIAGRAVFTSLNLGPSEWMPRRDAYRASMRGK